MRTSKTNTEKNSRFLLIGNYHFAILCFLFLIIYSICIVGKGKLPQINDLNYPFHVVDFSFGFCSKLLPGAITNLFLPTITKQSASVLETVFFIFFLLLLSVSMQTVFDKIPQKTKKIFIIICFLFITGPCTFGMLISQFGMLDSYIIYFFLLAVMCIASENLVFLSIPLGISIVFVHYSTLISYIPFLAILLTYRIFLCADDKKKKVMCIILVFFILFSFGFGFYFAIFEKNNISYSVEEFNEKLNSKGATYHTYYEYAFYNVVDRQEDITQYKIVENRINDLTSGFINTFLLQFVTRYFMLISSFKYLPMIHIQTATALLLITPIITLILLSFHKEKKCTTKKMERILLSLFPFMFFFVFFFGVVFSSDLIRWLSHAYIILFTAYLFVLYKKDASIIPEYLFSVFHIFPKVFILLFSAVYSLTIFDPYG